MVISQSNWCSCKMYILTSDLQKRYTFYIFNRKYQVDFILFYKKTVCFEILFYHFHSLLQCTKQLRVCEFSFLSSIKISTKQPYIHLALKIPTLVGACEIKTILLIMRSNYLTIPLCILSFCKPTWEGFAVKGGIEYF